MKSLLAKISATPIKEFDCCLQGKRLTLKRPDADIQSVRQLAALYKKNHTRLKPFKDWAHVRTVQDVKELLEQEKKEFRSRQTATYYIYTHQNECIGCAAVHCKGTMAEPYVFIDQAYSRQGYGREVIEMIEEAFFKSGYQKIVRNCNTKNPSVDAVARNARLADYQEVSDPEFTRKPDTKDTFIGFVKTKEMYYKNR